MCQIPNERLAFPGTYEQDANMRDMEATIEYVKQRRERIAGRINVTDNAKELQEKSLQLTKSGIFFFLITFNFIFLHFKKRILWDIIWRWHGWHTWSYRSRYNAFNG